MTPFTLSVVGEKYLPARCRPGTLAYCPTMDLVAVVIVLNRPGDDGDDDGGGKEEKLRVWRLNGQQVFGWDAPTGLGIQLLRWKMDGRMMAVGTEDGVVRLLSVINGGKVVHCLDSLPVGTTLRPKLSCLAWAVNFGDVKGMRDLLGEGAKALTLDDLLSLGAGKDSMGKFKADLPRELACGIEVETSIPKLSALPSGTGVRPGWGFGGTGWDDDVFSSRASIDAIFHLHTSTTNRLNRHDEVDVLITGFEEGTLHVRIFDCFDIGKVDLSSSLPKDSTRHKVVQHIAHPLSSKHALVVKSSGNDGDHQLHVIALDLNFIPRTSPHYLSTLATKTTQLLNLLRYLTQVSTHLSVELRGAFDLPGKFIRNLNETLAQSPGGPIDFTTATYQLVVTGDCSDELRDWMIDEIGERNLKRWEKASTLGMENVRRLVHECLLPAVERCQIVLSRLDGLSRFAKSAEVLGLETQSLNQVMDTVECLNLLGHYMLKTVGKELKQFTAFMKWLRLEVEIQGLERENAGGPGSERLEEMCMRRDEIETRTVLDYIQRVIGNSGMVAFVRPSADARGGSLNGPSYDWSRSPVDTGFYEIFKKMLRTPVGQAGTQPDLDDLLRRLTGQAQKVFDGIALRLRTNIMHSRVGTLRSTPDTDAIPARMIPSTEGHELILATGSRKASDQLSLHHIPWGKPQGSKVVGSRDFTLPANEAIVDMKFVDDIDLMVLSSGKGVAHLHTLDYSSRNPVWQERHSFDLSNGGGAPSELEVNGRRGRRVASVLMDDIRFTVFDLDSGKLDEEIPLPDQDVTMME